MKVLKPGRAQKGWAKEFECTGKGRDGGGCGATLLVEQADVYTWERSFMGRDLDQMWSFTCAACGVETNLRESPPFDAQTLEQWRAKRKAFAADDSVRLVDGHCSFCGERARLVCGEAVYICEPCVNRAAEIFAEKQRQAP
jgi:hypothetical protein